MKEKNKEETAPILGSWKNWYWFLVLFLVLQILLYYFFTQNYS